MKAIVRSILGLSRWVRPRLAKVRYWILSHAFERAGSNGSIGANVRFLGNTRIEVGDRIAIREGCMFGGNGILVIGSGTVINAGCILNASELIRIGEQVMLAPRVYVLDVDHRHDSIDLPIAQQGYVTRPVHIGDGAWIGTGVVITKGVTIGKGAIVAASSVVTRDVPDFTIVGGIPARTIRLRGQ